MFCVFAATAAAADAPEKEKTKTYRGAYLKSAQQMGLVTGSPNADLLKEVVRRVFVKNVFGGVAQDDMNALIYPLPTMGMQQAPIEVDLARLQKSAVTNSISAVISHHARKQNSIIGKTPTGGVSGGSLDLVMWRI